jgi:hypothetical protein
MTVNSGNNDGAPDDCEGCGPPKPAPTASWFGDSTPARIRWVPTERAWLCENCLREYTAWMERSHRYETEQERERFKPECLKRLEQRR